MTTTPTYDGTFHNPYRPVEPDGSARPDVRPVGGADGSPHGPDDDTDVLDGGGVDDVTLVDVTPVDDALDVPCDDVGCDHLDGYLDDDDLAWAGGDWDDDLAGFGVGAPLEDDDDLIEHLCTIVGPARTGRPSLWVTFLDDWDRPTSLVLTMDHIAPTPDRVGLEALFDQALLAFSQESHEDPQVLVAVVRRGGGRSGPFEARWAGAIREAVETCGGDLRAVVAIGEHAATVLQD